MDFQNQINYEHIEARSLGHNTSDGRVLFYKGMPFTVSQSKNQ